MGAVGAASTEVSALQQEVNNLRQRCAILEEENKDLKTKVSFSGFLNDLKFNITSSVCKR